MKCLAVWQLWQPKIFCANARTVQRFIRQPLATFDEMCEVSDAVRTLGREVPPSGARDPRPRGQEPQPSSESSQETTRLNRVTSSM